MAPPIRRCGTGRRGRVAALAGIIILGTAGASLLILWRRDTYARDIQPVYALIRDGEQNWASDSIDILHKMMARSWDRHALADHLLRESDGSLVAEGMILAVESRHPRARELVTEHVRDKRWNWALANNDRLAQQLLLYLDNQTPEAWVTGWLKETAGAR